MIKNLMIITLNKFTNYIKKSILYLMINLNLIVDWLNHIEQIADDRKTLNGDIMEDWAALDEIKTIAKNSIYYINKNFSEKCKEQ